MKPGKKKAAIFVGVIGLSCLIWCIEWKSENVIYMGGVIMFGTTPCRLVFLFICFC